jgi:type IV pilus assembly protein PilE
MQTRVKALSLLEMLLVLALIGILTLLVLPNFTSIISKAKGKEAEMQLNSLHMMQKAYFFEKSKYAESLDEVGFLQEVLITQGGQANYEISLAEVHSQGFIARATAVVDFDGDGTLNVWEINQDRQLVEVVKD